ncbi:hypothetical protein D3C74_459700 [compost metagenome]
MSDRTLRRCTCTTVITADEDNIGTPFGYTCRNGTHAHFRYELNVDLSTRIGIFQVIDQLCQILDRVDIVMRRWRDQTYTRC